MQNANIKLYPKLRARITTARHVLDETKQVRFALSYFSDLENVLETLLLGRVSDIKRSCFVGAVGFEPANLVGEMASFSFDYSACKEAGLVQ